MANKCGIVTEQQEEDQFSAHIDCGLMIGFGDSREGALRDLADKFQALANEAISMAWKIENVDDGGDDHD